ncbi:MAG TPA: nucleotidyltransferase domain-containing protein [Candidatus Atribacteria bacterium]|nr:nucleotidyltransferase domain-containing protein [Candidatus Atribacteria bacterium]
MNKEELKKSIISLYKKLNPVKIILFGSWCKEEEDKYSDVDIIVIYETKKRFLDRLKELYLIWDIPIAFDILAYTPEEFDKMLKEKNPFIERINREGEVIYERLEQGSSSMV